MSGGRKTPRLAVWEPLCWGVVPIDHSACGYSTYHLSSDPSRRGRAAVLRAGIEGDGRVRSGAVDGVNQRLEQDKPARRQADASADHHAVVATLGQPTLHGGHGGLIGLDETVLGLPAALGHVREGDLYPCVDLLRVHAWRYGRV